MLLQVLCFWYLCLLTGKSWACLNQSPCRLSLGVLFGLCANGYAVNTDLYKPIQLLWLCKLTSVVCCYLAFKFADGQESSVSQRDRGCWGVWRWALPSKPEQTTKGLQKEASEVGQFVEFVGTVETLIVSSPPIHSRPLSLQVTSCHCSQTFFLLRYAVIANGIHGFAIPKASSMRHKLTAVF